MENSPADKVAEVLTDIKDKIKSQEDMVNNPSHYGGKDNPYEAIKVIRAWGLGFNLGNTVKYISRAEKKYGGSKVIEDLKKARFYLDRQINNLENESPNNKP